MLLLSSFWLILWLLMWAPWILSTLKLWNVDRVEGSRLAVLRGSPLGFWDTDKADGSWFQKPQKPPMVACGALGHVITHLIWNRCQAPKEPEVPPTSFQRRSTRARAAECAELLNNNNNNNNSNHNNNDNNNNNANNNNNPCVPCWASRRSPRSQGRSCSSRPCRRSSEHLLMTALDDCWLSFLSFSLSLVLAWWYSSFF